MADPRASMVTRLFTASLRRRPVPVLLAALAVAIGTSVAAALLHVSGDVSRKLTKELRAFGPNLLVVPAESQDASDAAATAFLELGAARASLDRAGLEGAPVLYAVGRAKGTPVSIAGADLAALARLHPAWRVPADAPSWMGRRLLARLGARPGDALEVGFPHGARRTIRIGASFETGGPEDETWWLPLETVQSLAGLPGRASLIQARIEGGPAEAAAATRAIESDPRHRALTLHALSDTEAELLARMKRLMLFVTLAALAAAGLCAFGTLTDLALERRREIALLKALGAGQREIARLFLAESLAIGLAGGLGGWALGVFFAEVIGHQVFHATIALHADVPALVLALALAVSFAAGLGPLRLALAVEPATALKGE